MKKPSKKERYFKMVVSNMFDAINNVPTNNDIELMEVKINLLRNLGEMTKSYNRYIETIDILANNTEEKEKKLALRFKGE